MDSDDKFALDYKITIQQFEMLSDIRFKLLAFVPTVTGLAVTLVTDRQSTTTRLAVGVLGFVVTIGIVMYDLRNSKFYDGIVHRAKYLEARLGFPRCTECRKVGGVFNERLGARQRLFGFFEIWHDRGLALVYSAALASWLYLIVDALLSLLWQATKLLSGSTAGSQPAAALGDPLSILGSSLHLLSLLIAAGFGVVMVFEFRRLEGQGRPQPTEEMKRLMNPPA
jgi:hypothetical protein